MEGRRQWGSYDVVVKRPLGLGPARVTPAGMQAVVYERYGGPEVMALREVETPVPEAGQVRVALRAASINSWDWDLMHGTVLVRPWGLFRPRVRILGCDIAGRIEAVGEGVRRLQVGDAVFGDISAAGWGGFAERVCVSESALCHKPDGMPFEHAAAIPQAGVLALQGLRLFGELAAGKRLLINGAGGGVGTFALQLARAAGVEVTVVDTGDKLARLVALGAAEAIDYRTDDFTRRVNNWDFMLDVVGRRPPRQCLRALAPDGTYVMVGGTFGNLLSYLWLSPWARVASRRRVRMLPHVPRREDLEILCEAYARGELEPIIDRVCTLAEAPEAIEALGRGEVTGKAVVSIGADG